MAEEFTTVCVAQGIVRGRKVVAKASTYLSFQGIPYARPPVGPLRFKIAQPPDPWEGVRDALKEGSTCPQIDWIMHLPYRGDEDCLYLNVYSPKLPSGNQTVKYPVMVWIHGGGFEVGSGNGEMYGPEHLVGEDIVVVTINYRLGIFGFLNIGDVPYNLGLKDQVAALRWIKGNVAVFGGDPDNVTIFGESAGAASVNYHMISPMSKGLFHKAIMQSGCVLNQWSTVYTYTVAAEIAKELGSDAENYQQLIEFLSNVPARDLVEIIDKNKSNGKNVYFLPTPENKCLWSSGDEMFLPTHPKELMDKGQFHSVPCIIGVNSQEGLIAMDVLGALKPQRNMKIIGQKLEAFLPKEILSKPDIKDITEKIKTFYFGKEGIKETSVEEFSEYIGDVIFLMDSDKAVKILANRGLQVYYYHFDFSGKLNIFKNFLDANDIPGASHLDELGYLFATSFFNVPEVEQDSREGITRLRMLKLWTNFAKTGNPTPEFDPVIGVKWPCFTTEKAEYLNISDTLSVQKDLNKEKVDFWNNL